MPTRRSKNRNTPLAQQTQPDPSLLIDMGMLAMPLPIPAAKTKALARMLRAGTAPSTTNRATLIADDLMRLTPEERLYKIADIPDPELQSAVRRIVRELDPPK